jgi:hypothetical protein
MPFGGPKKVKEGFVRDPTSNMGGKPSPSTSSMYREVYEVLGFQSAEGSVEWWRERSVEVQAEEVAASKVADLTRLDASGHAVAITLPGPRAPTHEGHPAFGTRMWPPVQSIEKKTDDPDWAKPAKEQAAPAWFVAEDDAADQTDDIDGWSTGGSNTSERKKSCVIS